MTPLPRRLPRAAVAQAARARLASATPHTAHIALLDALAGYVTSLLAHGCRNTAGHVSWQQLQLQLSRQRQPRRLFHTYFVTHLPSSSLHPDSSRQISLPHHKLPRAASQPYRPGPGLPVTAATLAPLAASIPTPPVSVSASASSSLGRDLTVVRIPLRSAKHHFGACSARGQRPYNEDAYQAGTINMPAFAKRAPISLVRSAVANSRSSGEGITADSASGDPQIFYFGVFDGHGGSECSDFLRDELHGYIEKAAADFGLTSSLRGSTAAAAVAGQSAHQDGSDSAATAATAAASEPRAVQLQRELLASYRQTVGGYFRRFRPATFAESAGPRKSAASSSPSASSASSAPTVDSVLTYAFLRADFDFVTAQANKPDPDDPRVADFPLNDDEVLGAPYHMSTVGSSAAASSSTGSGLRFKGGSTASVILVSTPTPAPFWHPAARSSLLVGHVGDSRVLLCETATGEARPLTRDHHPSSPVETRRLTRFAESLMTDSFGEERISGLANSRAFGDIQSKRIGVSAEPELARVDMGPGQYAFVVLVSDGVSGTLSDQEIVDIVKEARTPEQAARDVVAYATEVSLDGDNATCLVVRLGGWERRSEGGLGSLGTKEIRDARLAEAQDPRRGRR